MTKDEPLVLGYQAKIGICTEESGGLSVKKKALKDGYNKLTLYSKKSIFETIWTPKIRTKTSSKKRQ